MADTVETVETQQLAAADIPPLSPSPLFDSDNDRSSDDDEQRQPDTKEGRRGEATVDIGATQVNERANMLYTRCYRGRSTHEQRLRIRERSDAERAGRESEEGGSSANNNGINNEDGEIDHPSTAVADRRRRSSRLPQIVSDYFGRASVVLGVANDSTSLVPVTAIVVEEADAVIATELGFCERNWKKIAVAMSTLLFILAIVLSTVIVKFREEDNLPQYQEPTASPTFDSKPTLSTIQDRGFIRCGLNPQFMIRSFYRELCRAVASVVVGDADSYEIVNTTLGTRWEILNNRGADLLIGANTYTIEREVRLDSAGSGFTFSAPCAYDGMAYTGNDATLIECAEKKERYGACSSLSICVFPDSIHFEYLSSNFPNGFYTTVSTLDEVKLMMGNGTCNVGASNLVAIEMASMFGINGKKLFTKDPEAIVTRNTDREFSDVVNWVLQALFYGEEQGLTKNATLCSTTKNVTSLAAELNYLNAVYCVGSYKDVYDIKSGFRGMNGINNGTSMHYPIPFGDLDYAFGLEESESDNFGPRPGSTFSDIIIDTKLNCGVFIQNGNDTESLAIDGLSEDCE